jgi:hypothetical protein
MDHQFVLQVGQQIFGAVHVGRIEETRNKYRVAGGCNVKHHQTDNIQMDYDVLKNCVTATEMSL